MLRRNGTRRHVVWCVSERRASEGRAVALWRFEAKMSSPAENGSAPGVLLCGVPGGRTLFKCVLGGVLLSRTLAGAVPSALSGLASGFGMDTGRFPVAVTTETTTWAVRQCVLVILLSGRLATHTVCGWWLGWVWTV